MVASAMHGATLITSGCHEEEIGPKPVVRFEKMQGLPHFSGDVWMPTSCMRRGLYAYVVPCQIHVSEG